MIRATKTAAPGKANRRRRTQNLPMLGNRRLSHSGHGTRAGSAT